MAYGWSGHSTETAIPARNTNYKSHLLSLDSPSIKSMVMADWGFLEEKKGIYDSLD